MTYRSESRGIMYTAPPSGDDEEDVRPEEATGDAPEERRDESPEALADATEAEAVDSETAEDMESETAEDDEPETPTLGPTTATTDANWTGSVPADD